MIPVVLALLLILLPAGRSAAVIELRLADEEAVLISSVYHREGTVFLPLREALPPLHLSGSWDAAKHLYRIKAPSGEMLLAPGNRRLRYGKRSIPLKQAPRIFSGELYVPEEVVAIHLPHLLDLELAFRNLDTDPGPEGGAAEGEGKGRPVDSSWLEQIVIDAGHGGDDPGGISPEGVKEKDLVLGLALRLEKILKMEGGAPVYMTRDGDYSLSLRRRFVASRGEATDNILLSLHMSAWRSSQTRGCTLYLSPAPDFEESNLLLAQSLDAALQGAGLADCSFERVNLFPLSRTPFPGVLLEIAYLTNPEEFALLSSSDGQERIARALTLGIKNYAASRPRRRMDVADPQ